MTKLGLVGARDDSNIVSPAAQQVVVDLGELAARLSNLLTVNRSGNLFDRVTPSNGLNQVTVLTAGASSYVRIADQPAANCGACFMAVCGLNANNYAGIERFVGYPSSMGVGLECWYAPVAYAVSFDLTIAAFDGVLGDQYIIRYVFATDKLQAYCNPGSEWTDIATVPLQENVNAFYKLKLIVDPSAHCYNKVVFNGHTYSIPTLLPYSIPSSEPPYLQLFATSHGNASGASKIALGDMITTQGEELTVC